MQIRPENPGDGPIVRAIHEAAFETPAEAGLVELLREQASPIVSIVAEVEGTVVGHILFSPVTLEGHSELKVMGLAPMAVAPDFQNEGIGSILVEEGLDECRNLGTEAVVVLGHPNYYPRFGFVPSTRFAIDSEYEVPEEVFLVLELSAGALEGKSGRAHYHPAFATL